MVPYLPPKSLLPIHTLFLHSQVNYKDYQTLSSWPIWWLWNIYFSIAKHFSGLLTISILWISCSYLWLLFHHFFLSFFFLWIYISKCLVSLGCITKYLLLGGLHKRNLFSPSFGVGKDQDPGAHQMGIWWELFPGVADGVLLCLHMAFPWCVHVESERPPCYSPYEARNPIHLT